MQHLNAKYIEHSGKGTESRPEEGLKKYMHPKYQRRIFFQSYGAEELANWGVEI
jgi:tryptophan 2,3-dioxygenase